MPQLSDTMTEGVVVSWEKAVGDKIEGLYQSKSVNDVRGFFAPGIALSFNDITDGLSNTIAFGEGRRSCDKAYRFAFWSNYRYLHSHNFGVDWSF